MHQPGTNIRNLRTQLNMNQTQLALAADVDQGTLSNIERGKGGYSREFVEKVAKALGVSLGVLFADGMTVDAAALGARRVPIIDENQVANWRGLEQADFDWDKQEFLFAGLANASRHAFALRIKDAVNAGVFDVGDEVIFDIGIQPWPGGMVVATDGSGKAHIGRFRELSDQPAGDPAFELVPANTFHAPMSSLRKGGLTLRGVMVEHRKYTARP